MMTLSVFFLMLAHFVFQTNQVNYVKHISISTTPYLDVSEDGSIMAISFQPLTLATYNPATKQYDSSRIATLSQPVVVAISKDKSVIATYDAMDNAVYVYEWDGTTYNSRTSFTPATGPLQNLEITSDNLHIIASHSTNVYFYKWDSFVVTYTTQAETVPSAIIDITHALAGQYVFFLSSNAIYVYHNDGSSYSLSQSFSETYTIIELSQNSTYLTIITSAQEIKIVTFETSPLGFTTFHQFPGITALRFSFTQDMNLMAVATSDQQILLFRFNGTNYHQQFRFKIPSGITKIFMSSDGQKIFTNHGATSQVYILCDVANCAWCSELGSCSSCKASFVRVDSSTCSCSGIVENDVCASCPKDCLVCTSSDTCTNCQTGFQVQNGKCTCLGLISGTSCSPCPNNCLSFDSCATCANCKTGYMQAADGSCLCSGFEDADICYSCIDNCDQCANNQTCTTCKQNYTLTNSQCQLAQAPTTPDASDTSDTSGTSGTSGTPNQQDITWWAIFLIVLGAILLVAGVIIITLLVLKINKLNKTPDDSKKIYDQLNLQDSIHNPSMIEGDQAQGGMKDLMATNNNLMKTAYKQQSPVKQKKQKIINLQTKQQDPAKDERLEVNNLETKEQNPVKDGNQEADYIEKSPRKKKKRPKVLINDLE